MGSDATATVFFGFPLPELARDSFDLNCRWAKERRPPEPEDRDDYASPEWTEWRKKLRAWETTPEHVEIDFGGSGEEENAAYFLHCPCYKKKVEWDGLLALPIAEMATEPPGALRYLNEFCDQFSLPKQKARWFLSARYF